MLQMVWISFLSVLKMYLKTSLSKIRRSMLAGSVLFASSKQGERLDQSVVGSEGKDNSVKMEYFGIQEFQLFLLISFI